jgi:hypothetical protein
MSTQPVPFLINRGSSERASKVKGKWYFIHQSLSVKSSGRFVPILGENRIRLGFWATGENSLFLYDERKCTTREVEIAVLEKISRNRGRSAILLLEGLGKDVVKLEVTFLGDH